MGWKNKKQSQYTPPPLRTHDFEECKHRHLGINAVRPRIGVVVASALLRVENGGACHNPMGASRSGGALVLHVPARTAGRSLGRADRGASCGPIAIDVFVAERSHAGPRCLHRAALNREQAAGGKGGGARSRDEESGCREKNRKVAEIVGGIAVGNECREQANKRYTFLLIVCIIPNECTCKCLRTYVRT